MRHVGDGDDQPEAAGGNPGAGRLGEHGVVEVARVLAVDGDQRQVAQVGAAAERGRAGERRLGQCRVREFLRNVVRVDGDQADRAGIAHAAQPLDHPRRLQAQAVMRQRLGQHEFVRHRAAILAGRHQPFRLGAAVGGNDAVFRLPILW